MFSSLFRYLRLGEYRLLLLAVLLVSVALTTVGTLSSRMEQAMQERTSAVLGSDMVISSTRPLDEGYKTLAESLGLKTARSIGFLSMIITDRGSRLAGVRAVTDNYPLRGEVLLKDVLSPAGSRQQQRGPNIGEIWAASQIVGDLEFSTDSSALLGDMQIQFGGEILLEPEGGAGMLRLAPRVIMNINDLSKTGLLTPASRVRYRLMVAGSQKQLDEFESAVKRQIKSYERFLVADIRRDEVRSTVGRIVSYLRLAVLLSVVLSVVAMALAAQGLWQRQSSEAALLRCLGQQHRKTMLRFAWIYLAAGVPVIFIGVLCGLTIQEIASQLIKKATAIALPELSLFPVLTAVLVSLLSLAAVVMPVLFAVRQISPSVLQREAGTDRIHNNRPAAFSVFIFIVLLIVILAGDAILFLTVLLGMVLGAIFLWSSIKILITIIKKSIRPYPASWFISLKGVVSNGGRSAWICSTFGVIIFALVLLGVMRNDIFEAWSQNIPEEAPNLFLINIKESNRQPLQELLKENQIMETKFYAIIRGRISAINDIPISDFQFATEEAGHRANHEFNITETSELPEDNRILAGEWFQEQSRGISVEAETADVLGLGLNDYLSMDIAGKIYQAPVTSIRGVKWDNMQSNFYIIASPGLFSDAPRNYISALYVKGEINQLVNVINRKFANVTSINIEMLRQRVRDLVDQGSAVISMVFIFTALSAVLVFAGILQGQRVSRFREIALLKSMGANKNFIRSAVLGEFALLGTISGILGSGLALLCSFLLARYLFDLDISIPWRWMVVSVIGGILAVSLTGYFSIRKLLGTLPVRLLSPKNG